MRDPEDVTVVGRYIRRICGVVLLAGSPGTKAYSVVAGALYFLTEGQIQITGGATAIW